MASHKKKLLLLAAAVCLALPALAEVDSKGFYMLRCASCHGSEGQGTKHMSPALAPALKGNPFIVKGSAAAIRSVVRLGRAGKRRLYDDTYPNMPGFGAEAVPDVDGLVAYLKGDLQK